MEDAVINVRVAANSDSDTIRQVKLIEKKTFPRSEALDFDAEMKKLNTTLLVAVTDQAASRQLHGYCVFARVRSDIMLHKICVVARARRRGVAYQMLQRIQQTMAQTSDQVLLWVDESRMPARKLYKKCGFEEVDYCSNYDGPGRHGIKMILKLKYSIGHLLYVIVLPLNKLLTCGVQYGSRDS